MVHARNFAWCLAHIVSPVNVSGYGPMKPHSPTWVPFHQHLLNADGEDGPAWRS